MTDGEHIRPLTSLRFIAALWVVLFHYWPKLDAPFTPMLVEKGYLGVELFFILSGFILSHVYRQSVAEGRFRYGEFLWARLARVYPLHLVTLTGLGALALAASAAGANVDPNIVSLPALPANLFLVQAWGLSPVAGWNHPSWSVSAEWFAYLTFPAFAWAALKLADRPLVALAGSAAFLAALYAGFEAIAGFSLTQATINWGALRIVPCFALGCALHGVWRAKPAFDRSTVLLGAAFAGAQALVAAAAGAPDVLIVLSLGAVILFLAYAAQTGSTVLSAAPLTYLGEISYAVYMVCVPWKIVFVNAASRILDLPTEKLPLSVWLIFIAALVPLAAALHHLVERPARTRMRAWSSSWRLRRLSAAQA